MSTVSATSTDMRAYQTHTYARACLQMRIAVGDDAGVRAERVELRVVCRHKSARAQLHDEACRTTRLAFDKQSPKALYVLLRFDEGQRPDIAKSVHDTGRRGVVIAAAAVAAAAAAAVAVGTLAAL